MSGKNIEIVRLKDGNINNIELRDSNITKLLLPTIIFIDKESKTNDVKRNYYFLEENNLIYKFNESMPYFQLLKNEIIDKNFHFGHGDKFYEIKSNDLFVLQIITEFINYNFNYTTSKNYYKKFFDKNNIFDIGEKISSLNIYIQSLSNIFNNINCDLFDISNGITKSFDEYLSKFDGKEITVSETMFGKTINIQKSIYNIKLSSLKINKDLSSKIRKLELDTNEKKFLYQDDFLEFVYIIMQEIKIIFSNCVNKIINEFTSIWNNNLEEEIQKSKEEEIQKSKEEEIQKSKEEEIQKSKEEEIQKSKEEEIQKSKEEEIQKSKEEEKELGIDSIDSYNQSNYIHEDDILLNNKISNDVVNSTNPFSNNDDESTNLYNSNFDLLEDSIETIDNILDIEKDINNIHQKYNTKEIEDNLLSKMISEDIDIDDNSKKILY